MMSQKKEQMQRPWGRNMFVVLREWQGDTCGRSRASRVGEEARRSERNITELCNTLWVTVMGNPDFDLSDSCWVVLSEEVT